jgi:hypothetical protein
VGASPRSASSDLALPDNRRRQSHKRVPIVGRCCRPFPLREFAAPIDRLRRVETRRKCSGDLTTQEPNSARIKHRRSVSGAAQMVAGQPENAVASASVSSAVKLLHPQPQTSTRSR